MELRSRPFVYANTSQLDLDSFLLYTTSIKVEVRCFLVGALTSKSYKVAMRDLEDFLYHFYNCNFVLSGHAKLINSFSLLPMCSLSTATWSFIICIMAYHVIKMSNFQQFKFWKNISQCIPPAHKNCEQETIQLCLALYATNNIWMHACLCKGLVVSL